MLTFHANPQHLIKALGEQDAKLLLGGDSQKTAVKTTVKTTVKTPEKILQLLEENPAMTLAQVTAEIEKTLRAVELASSKLGKAGRLRYVGPQKGGHWEVLK